MGNLRQLKKRIGSIEKIVKITQAMEVVSLFRLKRVEKQLPCKEDFFLSLQTMLNSIVTSLNYQAHPFFCLRKAENPLVLCLGSDKGLCGGFNVSLVAKVKEYAQSNRRAKFIVYGRRLQGVKRILTNEEMVSFDDFKNLDVNDLVQRLNNYLLEEKVYDGVVFIYNQMKKSLVGGATIKQILPFDLKREKDCDFSWEGKNIFSEVFSLYLKEAIETAMLESKAAEEFTRVFTMKQAKENAQDLQEKLNIGFHRLRQAVITRELTDVAALL